LAPEEDQGILFHLVKAPQYANLDYTERATGSLYDILNGIPEKAHVFTINGSGGVAQAFVGVLFKPWDERHRSAKQILGTLQGKLANVPGASVAAFSPPALPGSTGGFPMQFVIRTTGDYKQLSEVVDKLKQEADKSGLFIFTDVDLKYDTPQYEMKINAAKANRLGVQMQDVGSSLATLLGGNYVNRFNLFGRSYEVIPQVPREFRNTPDWLLRYQIRSLGGDLVPMSSFAAVKQSVQPNALTSFQQLNSATLGGVPFPGRTMGEALDFLKTRAKEIFPEGYTYDFGGDARQYEQEGNALLVTFVFALIVIFLVLAAQFESFRDPFVILIALPTSMFGALLPLNVGSVLQLFSINIYTQIGLVTLIGLISKHGILMVEFANRMQEEGMGRREAIEHAAGVRLRPILMTTAAMVVAMVPLITASGAGAQSRISIGVVIAAGMTIGTLFTLFVTPAVYTLIARDHSRDRRPAEPPALVEDELIGPRRPDEMLPRAAE
ncbi:MAG: efflux RND transporter permease subunit, partial [Parafilimonas terrae]|nr:efflux RND transporter permease subunit [Parafilimonas terrae]